MTGHKAYKDREWAPQPEAESALAEILSCHISACLEAAKFQDLLMKSCAVRLRDIVDHIDFSEPALIEKIERAGWRHQQDDVWENPTGLFPAFVRRGEMQTLWIRVENTEQFKSAYRIDGEIEGTEDGLARRLIAFTAASARLGVFERNGHIGYDVPDCANEDIQNARRHLQAFRSRRREFDTVELGLSHTEALVDAAVSDIGKHWACELWLKAEREFWMRRCAAGRRQKEKQNKAGIGWSNIDHHTYDGSREHYRHTIRILEKLGYELREILYAGELAGWGSQVLEQPALKSTIFADVDLAPDELEVDFAHDLLPPLDRHRRAGLVSALHGESILQAGLNHVAGLYDWRALNAQMKTDGIDIMPPFSDFDNLYQELTVGDWGAVDPAKVDALEADGHIPPDEAEKIRCQGAIMTHFENIERNEGYKGFNKIGIDNVLRKLDPRAYSGTTTAAE